MPRAAKTKSTANASTDCSPAFEVALEQLEDLVHEMESDQIPLEALIQKYEQGTKLYRICEERLNEARGRIEILRKKRNGETVLEPFGEANPSSEAEDDASDDSQNDGELF